MQITPGRNAWRLDEFLQLFLEFLYNSPGKLIRMIIIKINEKTKCPI